MQRQQKYDILCSTNGKVFSCKFKKKDNTIREMNCRTGVTSRLKGGDNTLKDYPQYFTVFDLKANDYRAINLDTLIQIKTGGIEINFPEENVA